MKDKILYEELPTLTICPYCKNKNDYTSVEFRGTKPMFSDICLNCNKNINLLKNFVIKKHIDVDNLYLNDKESWNNIFLEYYDIRVQFPPYTMITPHPHNLYFLLDNNNETIFLCRHKFEVVEESVIKWMKDRIEK